jgi:hypothetical protein
MTTLLVITTGQSDVQLVLNGERYELEPKKCGLLQDEIMKRSWSVVDSPKVKKERKDQLPDGDLTLCTPKLDAVLAWFGAELPSAALVFETKRTTPSDPRFTGDALKRRLTDRGVTNVCRHAFLEGDQRLEDPSKREDSVIRADVVSAISKQIAGQMATLKPDRIVLATTGGLAAANDVIEELVRLHAISKAQVTSLEVPDGAFAAEDDHAVEEQFHQAAGYRARWHALSLIEKGSLLGAWGAVSHLEGVPGQEWTQVIKWLAHFASSLPLTTGCDLAVLSHPRMAVRAALRVELALRTGDIPKAVHGTVAFFESALWDGLYERLERSSEPKKHRYFKVVNGNAPAGDKLLRAEGAKDNPTRPFQLKETVDGIAWYWVYDNDGGPGARIAEHFLARTALTAFAKVLAKTNDCDENFYSLRNDVAHNEPTPELMNEARTRMQNAGLWSNTDTFLSQPLAQNILKELGEPCPERLCNDLVSTVRERLLAIS